MSSSKLAHYRHHLHLLSLCWVTVIAGGCIQGIDLDNKLCPCIEGFVCIDGVCQTAGSVNELVGSDSDPGSTSGTGDAIAQPSPPLDAGLPVNPDGGADTGGTKPDQDSGFPGSDGGMDAGMSVPDDAGTETDADAGEELQSLEEIVSTTQVTDQFETALLQVLDELLAPPYTVLIPWDYALELLPYWGKITQLEWRGHLADFARAHVHEGLVVSTPPVETHVIQMLNGGGVEVSVTNGRIRFDGHRNIGDTPASDGHIFLLEDVLEPTWPQRTVADIIQADERFSELRALLQLPELAGTLQLLSTVDESSGITLFAPTNTAIPDSLSSPNAACTAALARLINNHVLQNVTSRGFTPTFRFNTRGGGRLSWDAEAQTVDCNSGESLTTVSLGEFEENFAINGVVHPVGKVLCMPAECQAGE